MHQVITFLGKYPKKTRYLWRDKIYEGEVFAQAIHQFLDFDRMLVFTTTEAHESTWPVLEALNDARIEEVSIETGINPEQIWSLFDEVIDRVGVGDTVTFDITHGLRSIPFLAFLFAAYLKTAKQVTIQGIYYGAFELGSSDNSVPAPVIDLSDYVGMLDWITATDQFLETGDARRLAGLLGRPGKKKNPSTAAAEALSRISQSAFLCQPFSLFEQAATLGSVLELAEEDFTITARPFGVLSQNIVQTMGGLAPHVDGDPLEMLRAEYRLIEWYYEHGQLIQALTLAREWLVDIVTFRLGQQINFGRSPRFTMERAVSGLELVGRMVPDETTGEEREFTIYDLNAFGRVIYETWEERPELAKLWSGLSNVRNNLNHGQHQKGPMKLDKLIRKADEVRIQIRELALKWDIIESTPSDQRKSM